MRSVAGTTSGSITISGNGIFPKNCAYIRVPILIIQGEDDQYGTVHADRDRAGGMLLPGRCRAAAGVKHNPASRGAAR